MNKMILYFAGSLLILTSLAQADNWPHWRGESGNGVSTTAKPSPHSGAPRRTSNGKWLFPEWVRVRPSFGGIGSSSLQRWGPETARRCSSNSFASIARTVTSSGSRRLSPRHLIRERTTPMDSLLRLPAPDGERVYAHFGSRGLYCYTMDGDLKWKRDDFSAHEYQE